MRTCPQVGWLVAALLLGGWGCIKVSWEGRLQQETGRLRGGAAAWSVDVRDQIGQGAALALLSGFRGVVADYMWVGAHLAWERREWFRLVPMFEMVCMLQPKAEIFWEMAAWHLAWNVAQAARYDVTGEGSEARRVRAQREWVEAGRVLLERGVANNPESGPLWFSLGWLYDQRLRDPGRAVACYRRAAALPGAEPIVRRLIGYRLEESGHREEAYAYWLGLWAAYPDKSKEPYMLWDRVVWRIQRLEEGLGIPEEKRLRVLRGDLPRLPELP